MLVHCSKLIKKASSCHRWQLTQIPTTDQYEENKTSYCSTLNGACVSHTSLQGRRGSRRIIILGWEMLLRRVFYRQSMAVRYTY